ncbi:hypothetical protein A3A63_04105 [Candidatus Gottesmanbacteria bacterium RIFCSPLOWO2_01_FULL_46_9]|uniref:Uncharacterized protein n=1 Tax=Candidatus Gottesmanbacteria bacterium RIFCSPLOWO2_01_FULL_46_9 TaxID=1798394 RepID=A0A1F6B2Y0_9BACT|nr:MAG: hypothetical protein A3A63_04105 [Candidatus Gottesmanbacteria bacterium RIFCSPLOWO2_01_FULL_46_9]
MVLKHIVRHYINTVNWKLLYQIEAYVVASLDGFSMRKKFGNYFSLPDIPRQKVFDETTTH